MRMLLLLAAVLVWGCAEQVRTGPMPSDTRIQLEQMGAVKVK